MESQIKNINEALDYIKDKYIVRTISSIPTYFIMHQEKILVRAYNAAYSISINEFLSLFKDEEFELYSEEDGYDPSKDEEYYSWQHK